MSGFRAETILWLLVYQGAHELDLEASSSCSSRMLRMGEFKETLSSFSSKRVVQLGHDCHGMPGDHELKSRDCEPDVYSIYPTWL
jgi:hypothetical protein